MEKKEETVSVHTWICQGCGELFGGDIEVDGDGLCPECHESDILEQG